MKTAGGHKRNYWWLHMAMVDETEELLPWRIPHYNSDNSPC
jgi:hypothetical protein